MAERFWSCEFGQDKVAVAETASTTAAADVEVRCIYDATANSKEALIRALAVIVQRIVEDNWPPA